MCQEVFLTHYTFGKLGGYICLYLTIKRKLRYYKVINPNLEDQKHLLVVISARKKINIAKIKMNSRELQSKTER